MKRRYSPFSKIDWYLVAIYVALVLLGWINIYAAVYDEDHSKIFDLSQTYGKQLVWILTSFFIAFIIILFDSRFFSSFAYWFYGINIAMLILVLLVGKEISGSKSWFQVGFVSIQPAEFAKFATTMGLAKYLSDANINLRDWKQLLTATLILLLPAGLILLQNDTGSAIVYASLIFVFYRLGYSANLLLLTLLAVVLFLAALLVRQEIILLALLAGGLILLLYIKRTWVNILRLITVLVVASAFVYSVEYAFHNVLSGHQRDRIMVLLGKVSDPKGIGYNVNQSLIAIGSGGFFGKGFLNGTQTKYNFVPEQSTDFIFCTIGEEWGFIGSSATIVLFLLLLSRIIWIAERQRHRFGQIYGYGVASILFFHFTINIGMTLGIVPVIGIPLPFISYGGSSLWAFTILLFIFIKQEADRLERF